MGGSASEPKWFRALTALFLSLTVLGIAACGGSDDGTGEAKQDTGNADQVAVLDVSQALVAAFHEEDTKALCSLVEPGDLKDYLGGMAACKKRLRLSLEQSDDVVPDFRLEDVKVNGDRAVATSAEEENGSILNFVKVNGKWFLDVNSTADNSTDAGSQATTE